MHPAWVIDLRDQCRSAKVPFFFKQWGGKNKKQAGRVLERRVWNEMPQDARVKSISHFTHESLWHGQMV
jgi:protein gp37